MKRCPTCRRDYFDDSLFYCLDDGTALIDGPASSDEPTTAILPDKVIPSEAASRLRTNDVTAAKTSNGKKGFRRASLDMRFVVGALGVAIFALVFYFGYRYFFAVEGEKVNSIAVLPFENRSGNVDTDYLSDGLADSLIYRLSQLPDLKVSPTSSVMRYKGKNMEIGQVAKDLQVDAVMSGRLVQRGDDLNISVQLIDARTQKLIWAEQYDRKMSDLLATQRQIATTIADKLQLKLVGDQAKGITKKYTNSNEAYDLYMRARYHFAKRTKAGMLQAADYYRQAIECDPNFALAYARIAEVYLNLPTYPYASPDESLPQAHAAIESALAIDSTLSEAHTFNAFYLATYEGSWAEAEREFKRAIELDPNSPAAHLRYGQLYLGPIGKFDEALAELKTAYDMEPLDIVTGGIYAWTLIWAGQREKGLELAKKTYDLDPGHPFARYIMAIAFNLNGKHDDAIAISEEALRSNPNDQNMLEQAGIAYARTGATSRADDMIGRLAALRRNGYVGPYRLATIYSAMEKKDEAFAELETALKTRDFFFSRLKVDPFLEPLRGDPRYTDMLRRVNFPN
jgi:TolB-like protein/Tfp pilus assembly protein PilF